MCYKTILRLNDRKKVGYKFRLTQTKITELEAWQIWQHAEDYFFGPFDSKRDFAGAGVHDIIPAHSIRSAEHILYEQAKAAMNLSDIVDIYEVYEKLEKVAVGSPNDLAKKLIFKKAYERLLAQNGVDQYRKIPLECRTKEKVLEALDASLVDGLASIDEVIEERQKMEERLLTEWVRENRDGIEQLEDEEESDEDDSLPAPKRRLMSILRKNKDKWDEEEVKENEREEELNEAEAEEEEYEETEDEENEENGEDDEEWEDEDGEDGEDESIDEEENGDDEDEGDDEKVEDGVVAAPVRSENTPSKIEPAQKPRLAEDDRLWEETTIEDEEEFGDEEDDSEEEDSWDGEDGLEDEDSWDDEDDSSNKITVGDRETFDRLATILKGSDSRIGLSSAEASRATEEIPEDERMEKAKGYEEAEKEFHSPFVDLLGKEPLPPSLTRFKNLERFDEEQSQDLKNTVLRHLQGLGWMLCTSDCLGMMMNGKPKAEELMLARIRELQDKCKAWINEAAPILKRAKIKTGPGFDGLWKPKDGEQPARAMVYWKHGVDTDLWDIRETTILIGKEGYPHGITARDPGHSLTGRTRSNLMRAASSSAVNSGMGVRHPRKMNVWGACLVEFIPPEGITWQPSRKVQDLATGFEHQARQKEPFRVTKERHEDLNSGGV